MTRQWEQLEAWLVGEGFEAGGYFTNAAVRDDLQVPGWRASRLIESYLDAQRSGRVDTAYVLHRRAGTRCASTVWEVGTSTEHARDLGAQLGSDLARRVEREVFPTLELMAEANPRARRAVAAIKQQIGGSVELIAAMLEPA